MAAPAPILAAMFALSDGLHATTSTAQIEVVAKYVVAAERHAAATG